MLITRQKSHNIFYTLMKITRFQFLFSVMYSPDATENTSVSKRGLFSTTYLACCHGDYPKGKNYNGLGIRYVRKCFRLNLLHQERFLKLYVVYHNNVFYFCNCINQYTLKQVSNDFCNHINLSGILKINFECFQQSNSNKIK